MKGLGHVLGALLVLAGLAVLWLLFAKKGKWSQYDAANTAYYKAVGPAGIARDLATHPQARSGRGAF